MDFLWYKCYLTNKLRQLKKISSISEITKYAGKEVMSVVDTNKYISCCINNRIPSFIGRYGHSEMQVIISLIRNSPYSRHKHIFLQQVCGPAGFFPNDLVEAKRFARLMIECTRDIDLCGIWNLFMEDYMLQKYAPDCRLTHLGSLEPYTLFLANSSETKPWSHSLAGKKVLVIHPFKDSIVEQYNTNREHIFENLYQADDILPKFELKVIKAVQTIYGEESYAYENWFEALSFMIEQVRMIDFDVAIIGCGAYGFPLAAQIKQMGKVAIHLGGATQRLFGITGRRWHEQGYSEFSEIMENDSWIYPSESERPREYKNVEGGCYW